VWSAPGSADRTVSRELVLPTGTMHIVFRLDHALRLYADPNDPEGRVIGHDIAGGVRAAYYLRDISRPTRSIGAQLQPAAAGPLLGVPAGELAERHTLLDDLWGRDARRIREQLLEAESPAAQLALFEDILAARLPRVRGVHPAVAQALQQLPSASEVGTLVRDSGYSHRRFIELFHESVGLTPKRYTRILRFQGALAQMARRPSGSWADLALELGYSDQAHFNRDFREFSGLAPGVYRRLSPAFSNHVPLLADP